MDRPRMKYALMAWLLAAVVSLMAVGCRDAMQEHYAEPEWLKGSISQILTERGDCSLFLRGVERCGYTRLLDGKSILTVMVPDDAAMEAYLTVHYGTADIDAVPLDEVKKLIGFHILYYAFDKGKLENFRPREGDGATDDERLKNAGLYYKFRTRSQDAPSKTQPARMWNAASESIVDTAGVTVDVYHRERFIPLFSQALFDTKLIDAKANYTYFFPDTEWHGNEGFNVSDAIVTDYATIAKNGYIYFVDRVIRPLETIHTELERDPHYSRYLSFYDQYAYWQVNDELTTTYGGGATTYYERLYNGGAFNLPNIASEWPTDDYADMVSLSSVSFSVFAPTDDAFDEFYRSYWGDEGTGYPAEVAYDSISSDAIGYLLSNSFCASSIVFPEEITKGNIKNAYTGTVIHFDVDEVPQEGRKMCVNGALYGQRVLTPPAVFGSVTGPAYKYKRYNLFLKMLTASQMQSTLTSDAVSFIMLYPSDEQFRDAQIWLDETSGKIKNGPVGSTSAGNLGSADQAKYVNAHIVSLPDGAAPLATSGLAVYRTLSTDYKLYWYVRDGRITNSFRYNNLIRYSGNNATTLDDVYTDLRELTFRGGPWTNGHAYAYGDVNVNGNGNENGGVTLFAGSNTGAIYPSFVPMIYTHRNDEGTLFQGFIQLLLKADMMDEQAQTMNYMTEDCLMLVPTTEALVRAILDGSMPYVSAPDGLTADDPDFWSKIIVPDDGSDAQAAFQHYLLQYFYPESTSPLSDYPYPGAEGLRGADDLWSDPVPSISDLTVTPSQCVYVQFVDNTDGVSTSLSFSGLGVKLGNKTVPFHQAYDCLPFVFEDGGVQFLDGVFEDVWPK